MYIPTLPHPGYTRLPTHSVRTDSAVQGRGPLPGEEALGSILGLIPCYFRYFSLYSQKCQVWYVFLDSRKDVILVKSVKDRIDEGSPSNKPKVNQA